MHITKGIANNLPIPEGLKACRIPAGYGVWGNPLPRTAQSKKRRNTVYRMEDNNMPLVFLWQQHKHLLTKSQRIFLKRRYPHIHRFGATTTLVGITIF